MYGKPNVRVKWVATTTQLAWHLQIFCSRITACAALCLLSLWASAMVEYYCGSCSFVLVTLSPADEVILVQLPEICDLAPPFDRCWWTHFCKWSFALLKFFNSWACFSWYSPLKYIGILRCCWVPLYSYNDCSKDLMNQISYQVYVIQLIR